jgi:hypothetical protein
VTSCSLADRDPRFGRTCCFYPVDGGSRFVLTLALAHQRQPKLPWSYFSAPWDQISYRNDERSTQFTLHSGDGVEWFLCVPCFVFLQLLGIGSSDAFQNLDDFWEDLLLFSAEHFPRNYNRFNAPRRFPFWDHNRRMRRFPGMFWVRRQRDWMLFLVSGTCQELDSWRWYKIWSCHDCEDSYCGLVSVYGRLGWICFLQLTG